MAGEGRLGERARFVEHIERGPGRQAPRPPPRPTSTTPLSVASATAPVARRTRQRVGRRASGRSAPIARRSGRDPATDRRGRPPRAGAPSANVVTTFGRPTGRRAAARIGAGGPRRTVRTQDAVGRGDHSRAGRFAGRSAGRRAPATRAPRPGASTASGRRTRRRPRSRPPSRGRAVPTRPARRPAPRRAARPPGVHPVPRSPRPAGRGRARRPRRSPRSGSRNGRFRWTGPGPRGPATASATARAASERHDARAALVGHAGIGEPPGRPTEQVGLVDGLGGAHVAQLGGPVGGAHQQRHPGQVGLDHRGVQLGGGRPAGRDHDRRDTGGQADPERA